MVSSSVLIELDVIRPARCGAIVLGSAIAESTGQSQIPEHMWLERSLNHVIDPRKALDAGGSVGLPL